MTTLPTSMLAAQLKTPVSHAALDDAAELSKALHILEIPVAKLAPGEVLVKVSRGTINPNDLYHLKGEYVMTTDVPFPAPIGFEGAGVVFATGGGLVGRIRLGQRVAFYQLGMFAEYVVCKALDLIPIPSGISFETAACSVANPMTMQSMLQVVRKNGSPAFINTAAASALGRLLIRGANAKGLDIICVVRSEAQADLCRQEGAKFVVNSKDEDFTSQLKNAVDATRCRLALDCIGGTMPGTLLGALPPSSVVKLYGYLDPSPVQFPPQSIYQSRVLETFEVNEHLEGLSLLQKGLMARAIAKGMGNTFTTKVQRTFPLSQTSEAFAFYSANMTGGKVQIVADENLA